MMSVQADVTVSSQLREFVSCRRESYLSSMKVMPTRLIALGNRLVRACQCDKVTTKTQSDLAHPGINRCLGHKIPNPWVLA